MGLGVADHRREKLQWQLSQERVSVCHFAESSEATEAFVKCGGVVLSQHNQLQLHDIIINKSCYYKVCIVFCLDCYHI